METFAYAMIAFLILLEMYCAFCLAELLHNRAEARRNAREAAERKEREKIAMQEKRLKNAREKLFKSYSRGEI